jgi:hypothetical protein
VISHSFAFSASRSLKFSYKSILPCTAFPSTLVSILELSPPLPVLLRRGGGLSRLNTRAISVYEAARDFKLLPPSPDAVLSSWSHTILVPKITLNSNNR